MLLPLSLTFLAAKVVLAAAALQRSSGELPATWSLKGKSTELAAYNFTIHITGSNIPGLTTRMESIVADGSGKWLSDSELAKYVTPTAAASKAVSDFLKDSGFAANDIQTSKYGDRVTVKTTIGKTASLFSAELNDYNADRTTIARTRKYTIPSSISSYVDDISPIALVGTIVGQGMLLGGEAESGSVSRLTGSRRSRRSSHTPSLYADLTTRASEVDSSAVPSSCNMSSVTPQCRKDYYKTASYTRSVGSKIQPNVAVIGFQDQWINDDLISVFTKKYAPNIPQDYSIPVSAFNGAAKTGRAGFEATLNIEVVLAEIHPMTTNYISMASLSNRADPWLLAFNTLIEDFTASTRPPVVSISYSGDEKFWSPSQAAKMCEAAQKLTALGTTIVVSTGDYGVAGTYDASCPPFVARYPSGCQYILAVGATEGFDTAEQPMEPNQGGLGLMSSGSGASNIFPIPAYQASQVKAYQMEIGAMGGAYNMSGRMFPDVAAQGSSYSIIFNGRDTVASGTSASTPYVAALIALVNDKRKKASKGLIGWANPALYKASLKDITLGGSNGCRDTKLGFPSKPGFDAATGNGSPMFDALSKAYGV